MLAGVIGRHRLGLARGWVVGLDKRSRGIAQTPARNYTRAAGPHIHYAQSWDLFPRRFD